MKGVSMQSQKVDCIHCIQYRTCSQQTRMFVNFCGKGNRAVQPKIDQAVAECLSRKGKFFKYESILPFSKPILVPVAAA